MKNIKKIGALVLALVLVLSLTATAFAADGDTPNSNYNGSGEGNTNLAKQTNVTEVSITKDIVLYNAEASSIYTPNVTYTYEVAPAGTAATGTQVTGIILNDTNDPHKTTTVTVKNGVAGGVKLATTTGGTGAASINLVFAPGTDLDTATPLRENVGATTSNATAAKTSKNIYIQFDPSAIYGTTEPHGTAGIYRYKITDTTSRDTLAAAGILRNDDYDASYKTLYLDVYLKNAVDGSGNVTGLEVYGYVLFKSGTADTDFQYVNGSTETYKLTGFNVDSELGATSGSTTPVISDQYHTYNLKVTKTTTGALADKSHYFPFNIDVTQASGDTATKVYVTYSNASDVKNGSTAVTTATGTDLAVGGTATNFTGKLKNGGEFKLTGIPTFITYNSSTPFAYSATTYATANAKETNDTYDTYVATATVDAETTTNVQLSYKADSSATVADTTASAHNAVLSPTGDATLKTALIVDGKDTSDTVVGNSIDFTNTLDAISPTGVVLRVAPYAFMLATGMFLLLVSRHRRKDEEEYAMA